MFDCTIIFFVLKVKSAQDEENSHGPVILRKKRAAGKEKNTCQLFIQTDHLFYKFYGTREAVIAQVYSQTYVHTSFETVLSASTIYLHIYLDAIIRSHSLNITFHTSYQCYYLLPVTLLADC